MSKYKESINKDGEVEHWSVGALIERDGKYLLIDRVNPPLGYAGLAGHIDEGETPEETVAREVKEESELLVTKIEYLFGGLDRRDECSRGATWHHWHAYRVETQGEPVLDEMEAKSMDWYTIEEIKKIKLEEAWEVIFTKLGLLS